ncbi:Lsr2 dimerization domain-containing protein [Glutamicibacter ardleyensis]|uniref:Lsr2 dimerization domain-containing protein n=1 Tax=Glutamicibacter ardleyensis TaxID=225894 RepID=UPI003FD3443D
MAMIRVSDISGDTNANAIHFSVDQKSYEIDLTDAETEQMQQDISRFLSVARKASAPGKPQTSNPNAKRIREWAQKNGHSVNPQGRLPKSLINLWLDR